MEMLQAKWDEGKFVCVGLDASEDKLPATGYLPINEGGYNPDRPQFAFNRAIVDATKDLVCAYKPNLAFYRGAYGKAVLFDTIAYIRKSAPGVLVILDAKQADIGNTNDGYVAEDFGSYYGADAITVHPYLGMEAMKPFLDQADKGIIVLCRTSNPGAGEFQDLPTYMNQTDERDIRMWPLYQQVAWNISSSWNYNGNCAVVVGATYPSELAEIRQIVGDMPILIPGHRCSRWRS